MTYKVQIDDQVREATAEEAAKIDAMHAEAALIEAEQQARAEARRSAIAKLSALGLTDTEITALLGA